MSNKRLFLEMIIAYFEKVGVSLVEQHYPEYRGIERDEIERGR